MSLPRRIPPRDPTASAEQEAARLRAIVEDALRPAEVWAADGMVGPSEVEAFNAAYRLAHSAGLVVTPTRVWRRIKILPRLPRGYS